LEWTNLLNQRIKETYRAADNLMGLLTDGELGWKPATGQNWMTAGQLLKHMTESCGMCCQAFATGDWSFGGSDEQEECENPEGGLLPADALPTIGSVAEARKLLEQDRLLSLRLIEEVGAERLDSELSGAPWDPDNQKSLGHNFLDMVGHLESHKSQLFYYLKLMGKDVNTMTLWGM